MRRILAWLIVCAITVAIAWYIASLSGEVSATVGDRTVRVSLAWAVAAVGAIVLVAHLLLRLLTGLAGLPARLRGRSARRRREAGDAAISRALVALAASDQGRASRETTRARRRLGDTPQTLLLAAEAARLAGNDGEAEAIYEAMTRREDAAFLGLRGLFRQAMAREDWRAAAGLARRAEAIQPGAAWLRKERSQLAVRTEDWARALTLAAPETPHEALATAAANAEPDPAEALRLARRTWKANPGFTPAALAYVQRLRAAGHEVRAQAVLRRAWAVNPHPDLGDAFQSPIADKLVRVREAGRLVQGAPEHPESHLLLGRLSLDAGLTGEARRHAEAAERAGMNQKRLWMLMADIEAQEHGEGTQLREALRRAAVADPDPAWRCDNCGAEVAAWRAACPGCHAAGRIRWGTPQRLALPVRK